MTTTHFEGAELEAALSTVLETMFYCPLEESREGVDAVPQDAQTAVLEFTGPISGRFQLSCSAEAATLLAENFHGEESDSDAAQAVITELANMVCGNLLSRVDTHAVFRLSSPCLGEWTDAETALCARLEQGRVWVSIEAKPAPVA